MLFCDSILTRREKIMARLFGIFDFTKEGKGVKKEDYKDVKPFSAGAFFRILKNNFWGLSGLNILYLLVNFPLFFGLFALSGNLNIDSLTPTGLFYPQLQGMMSVGANPHIQTIMGYTDGQATISAPTSATVVVLCLTALVIFTFGIANCGLTYILRSYARMEPVFVASEFFGSIRDNWKQAIPLGIIDIVFSFASVYVYFFWMSQSGFVNDIMFFMSIFVLFVYFFMRFYMYLLMITFDLSIMKILKNSLIFALLGVKRNFAALLGILAVVAINYYIFFIFFPIAIILPFVITLSLCSFVSLFCTYPVVKKYMIDPIAGDSQDEYDDSAPIFLDRG